MPQILATKEHTVSKILTVSKTGVQHLSKEPVPFALEVLDLSSELGVALREAQNLALAVLGLELDLLAVPLGTI